MQDKLLDFEKKLATAKEKLQYFKKANPAWPEDPQANLQILDKRLEENEITNNKLVEEINSTLKLAVKKDVRPQIARLKEEQTRILKEREAILTENELYQNTEFREYMRTVNICKDLESQIKEINKTKVSALKEKKTPFGKVAVPFDHLTPLSKLTDYHKLFGEKYKLAVKQSSDKLEFNSIDNKESIEITQEGIKGNFDSTSEGSKMVEAMVDLYLKSIEGQAVSQHKIESKNVSLLNKIEVELADKLQKRGDENANINGIKATDVLKGLSPVSKT